MPHMKNLSCVILFIGGKLQLWKTSIEFFSLLNINYYIVKTIFFLLVYFDIDIYYGKELNLS